MFKKFDWGQWVLYLLAVVVVEVASVALLWKAYPGKEMKIIGWVILVLVLGFSGYATYKSSEPDDLVRQVGIIGKVVLALLGVAALYGHIAMSRELSTAREGYAEYQTREKFQQSQKDRDAAREIELKRADAEQQLARARLEAAETQKLRLLLPSQRQGQQQPKTKTLTPTPPPPSEENVSIVATPPRAESAVREDWLSYFQAINLLQILFSVLGALGVSVARHWDRKGVAGVPDWLERVWQSGQSGQDYVRANYAQHAQRIEAALRPGMVPAGNL
jgi:hypothetical protein